MNQEGVTGESPAPAPVRVLLADDHDLVRAGFRTLLRAMSLTVVAEASTGTEALRLAEHYRPDVVLMDIAMPELNGLDTTTRLAQELPSVRVIILSMYANAEYARRALSAGAAGYLLKNSKAPELELAIKAALRGEIYLTPAIAKMVAADYARAGRGNAGAPGRLTARQLEVLQLIARGYTRKQIAEKLFISPKTFDTYRAQIMDQLGIEDVAGMVHYAHQMGLVTPDD